MAQLSVSVFQNFAALDESVSDPLKSRFLNRTCPQDQRETGSDAEFKLKQERDGPIKEK